MKDKAFLAMLFFCGVAAGFRLEDMVNRDVLLESVKKGSICVIDPKDDIRLCYTLKLAPISPQWPRE